MVDVSFSERVRRAARAILTKHKQPMSISQLHDKVLKRLKRFLEELTRQRKKKKMITVRSDKMLNSLSAIGAGFYISAGVVSLKPIRRGEARVIGMREYLKSRDGIAVLPSNASHVRDIIAGWFEDEVDHGGPKTLSALVHLLQSDLVSISMPVVRNDLALASVCYTDSGLAIEDGIVCLTGCRQLEMTKRAKEVLSAVG